jgi:starch synthase
MSKPSAREIRYATPSPGADAQDNARRFGHGFPRLDRDEIARAQDIQAAGGSGEIIDHRHFRNQEPLADRIAVHGDRPARHLDLVANRHARHAKSRAGDALALAAHLVPFAKKGRQKRGKAVYFGGGIPPAQLRLPAVAAEFPHFQQNLGRSDIPRQNQSCLLRPYCSPHPECVPLVKTGGLGDVSAALPAALHAQGIDTRVLLPGYPPVLDADPGAREIARITVFNRAVRLLESKLPSGVPLIIVDAPTLFARNGGPYQDAAGEDWNDNALRFGVLSKVAALLGTEQSPIEWRPNVVHCNDWPTGAGTALPSLRARLSRRIAAHHPQPGLPGDLLLRPGEGLELPPESVGTPRRRVLRKGVVPEGRHHLLGAINTVSPTYAREIQMPELGFGMDGVLRGRTRDLFGVLNGIDVDAWDPEKDPLIAARYGAETLDRKLTNKRALKQRVGLGGPHEVPLASIVSRLTHQKGIDIIIEALPELAKIPIQVAVVGAGDKDLVEKLRAAQKQFPETLGAFHRLRRAGRRISSKPAATCSSCRRASSRAG